MNRDNLEAWLKEHGLKIDEVLIIDPENSISSDNNESLPSVSEQFETIIRDHRAHKTYPAD